MELAERLDHWIFDSFKVTPAGLGLYRIAYALFVLLIIAPGHSMQDSFYFLSDLPDALFLPPPGPMRLPPGFPPPYFTQGLHLLISLSLAALLFGYRTRWASMLTGSLFLIGYGFSYSLGKINHNVLFVLLPFVMAVTNWGAAYSLDALNGRVRRAVNSWPITLLALLVGFAMFTAGLPKILGGWLDPSTHATQGHFVKQFFVRGRQDLLAPLFIRMESGLFWELLDYATVLLEIGFLAAVFHPSSTRWFAGLAVLFHTGTLVMLNIAFTFHLIIYAAFIRWDLVARHMPSFPGRLFRRVPAILAVISVGLLYHFIGSPLLLVDTLLPFNSDVTAKDVLAHSLGVALLGGFIFWVRMRAKEPFSF